MLGRTGKCPGCGRQIQIPAQLSPKADNTEPIKQPLLQIASPPQPTVVQPSSVVPSTTNVVTPAGQPSAVQVNVQNSNVSNSLGIASLILGILSFFICWMPFIGFALSGLGLVLGVWAFVMSIARKGTGIGYAIAGIAVSGIGVLMGIFFILALKGMADGLDEVAKQMDRDRQSQNMQSNPPERTATKRELPPLLESETNFERPQNRQRQPREAPRKQLFRMNEIVIVDGLGYTVTDAIWSQQLTDNEFLDTPPRASYLILQLGIVNANNEPYMRPPVLLIDENGTEYGPSANNWVAESSMAPMEMLNPEVPVIGTIAFDVPRNHRYRLRVSGGVLSQTTADIAIRPRIP